MIKLLLLASSLSPLMLLAAVALAETEPTGKDFGGHVPTHAPTPGFGQGLKSGRHHQGFSNGVRSMPC